MANNSKLCFVGAMLGRSPRHVASQGEILSDLFKAKGYPVIVLSRIPNRYFRFFDIMINLIRRRRKIDIECLQIYSGPSFIVEDLASKIAKCLGFRIVMHLHGGGIPKFILRHPHWFKRVISRADAIVTPSEYLARSIRDFGIEPEVIPNIIELKNYPYRFRASIQPRLFWMRAFHDIYNPEMAVRVLLQVRKYFSDATLTLAGPDFGTLRRVRQWVEDLGLSQWVRFPGRLDEEAKIREAAEHDIYLNTNRVDNMPVSVIEMAAMGLPIVTTSVGGVRDLLTPWETGLLVPDNQDKVMAEEVLRLLRTPKLVERLSQNGRSFVERYTSEKIIPEWEKIFNKLHPNGKEGR